MTWQEISVLHVKGRATACPQGLIQGPSSAKKERGCTLTANYSLPVKQGGKELVHSFQNQVKHLVSNVSTA